jgi:hypothetical protein
VICRFCPYSAAAPHDFDCTTLIRGAPMIRRSKGPEEVRNRVASLGEAAAIAGISLATLKRLLRRGFGPTVLQLSPGRVGIRIDDLNRWLDSRARKRD